MLDFVTQVCCSQPRLGGRKLAHLLALHDESIVIGRDKLFSLLREHRMLVPSRRAYHKTTQSHHRFYCHPNLLKAGPEQVLPQRPNHVWVADITYLPVRHGEAYLSLVTDAFSRKIVGYHVHDNLKAISVAEAFKHALKQRKGAQPLIHHSDRGIQYCSGLYQQIHQRHGVTCSMTDGYDCYQNALAERVNGILKQEYLPAKGYDMKEMVTLVAEAVELYNTRRPHMSLEYKTPDEIHRAL